MKQGFFLSALLCCFALPALSQAAMSPAGSASGTALTAEDLTAFLDGLLPMAMGRGDIAGAAIVVVKDGRILVARGYGYADVASKQPVDPYRTVFRPGSIAKLFTWTAVMQLVEQGKLDLDRDVNEYLDFKIPPTFGKPITLRNLMTHTAGFEDHLGDMYAERADALLPYGEALKSSIPKRIFPPGEIIAYSNYGAGLAGYIVQRAAGKPFAQYVQEHIFAPLTMTHSSMEQPLPADLMQQMAKGYTTASDGKPHWYEYVQWPGVGAAALAAADMAPFMIAYLHSDNDGDPRLLEPKTIAMMASRAITPAPGAKLNTMGLGFYRDDRNGHPVLAHDGASIVFKSELRLVQDENVGLFLTLNSAGRDDSSFVLRQQLYERFMDRYYPATAQAEPPTRKSGLRHGEELAGRYVLSLRTESDFFKFTQLLSQPKVSVDGSGILTVDSVTAPNGQPRRWREVGDYVWREVDGQAQLAARHDGQHHLLFFANDYDQPLAYQPVSWAENAAWNLPAFIVSLAVLACHVVLWPVIGIIRRRGGQMSLSHEKSASLLMHLTSIGYLLFFAAWGWLFASFVELIAHFNPSIEPYLRMLQLLGLVCIAGAVLSAVKLIGRWRQNASMWSRMGRAGVVLAYLDLTWVAVEFHLLWPSIR